MSKAAGMFVFGLILVAAVPASAQSQPPIQSPQDAACRNEAASRVFTAPNPKGLDLYAVGRQIWLECMRRAERVPHGHAHAKRKT